MHIILLVLVVILLFFGPQLWVKWVLNKHATERKDFPGNGAEFARHLLKQLKITDVSVEQTDRGDHYDPPSRAVRLSPDNFRGRSLTAITVAAHEVGHALQHAQQYPPLRYRERLVVIANAIQQFGNVLFIGIPIMAAITRAPTGGILMLIAALASFGAAALVHLITLPVELDASFNRALPILKAGRYLNEQDQLAARHILRAAAFTYVAASLASLLNLWRWARLLRR